MLCSITRSVWIRAYPPHITRVRNSRTSSCYAFNLLENGHVIVLRCNRSIWMHLPLRLQRRCYQFVIQEAIRSCNIFYFDSIHADWFVHFCWFPLQFNSAGFARKSRPNVHISRYAKNRALVQYKHKLLLPITFQLVVCKGRRTFWIIKCTQLLVNR